MAYDSSLLSDLFLGTVKQSRMKVAKA